MKLSDKTISLLKNFSTINQSILFKQGTKLSTISVMKNILAEATIEEELPKDFGIYDLGQFLNGLSLHHNPDLDFQDDSYVVIKEGRSRSKYFFADSNCIVTEGTFSFNFKVENIKILPGNYNVVVSQKLLSRFTSKNQDLTYYIALEPDSTFE